VYHYAWPDGSDGKCERKESRIRLKVFDLSDQNTGRILQEEEVVFFWGVGGMLWTC
jgi:hypothetical protein